MAAIWNALSWIRSTCPSRWPRMTFSLWTKHLCALPRWIRRAVEVVKLCFFLGLTQPQAAEQMNVSLSIIERLWSFARAWLFREMLVTLHDGVPGPKVIDFGLAKAIEGRLTD